LEYTVHESHGRTFVEGAPGRPLIGRPEDSTLAIGVCFEQGANALLLYPENLSGRFFDLSSGEAGEILQKLRNYNIRLAVVRTPELKMSSRFGELLADEARGPYFRLFDDRAAAAEWIGVG
jgi:hypothetical protein